MKILLVYAPFCTPATPPYAIANIASFLKSNLPEGNSVDVLDLNIEFHSIEFKAEKEYYHSLTSNYNSEDYNRITTDFRKKSAEIYKESNNLVVAGKLPELFSDMLGCITVKKPDVVAFSIVYSSQAFYVCALIEALHKVGIKCIVGGPAVNGRVRELADACLANELDLLEYAAGKIEKHDSLVCDFGIDFSILPLKDYFVPSPVIPIKTSSTCYYQQCAFCTHDGKGKYYEYDLDQVGKTIKVSKAKNLFIIDDMVHKDRLLKLADLLEPLGVSWTCQLKPTKDLDLPTFKILRKSGLKFIIWGVESGCDRILTLMNKNTNKKDIVGVLEASHAAGITNSVYMMFGFPTETKEEFIETIDFLKSNSANIDLISTSIFGLQKGSPVYDAPEKFGITKIKETKRTVLEPSIAYEVISGMTQEEANKMRSKYKRTLEKLNKYPKMMNIFREHMLCLV